MEKMMNAAEQQRTTLLEGSRDVVVVARVFLPHLLSSRFFSSTIVAPSSSSPSFPRADLCSSSDLAAFFLSRHLCSRS